MADCAHCGEPAPAGDPAFCCAGCRTVYEALHASGLADFYRVRARVGGDASPATDAQRTDRYLRFDDPDFQSEFCPQPGTVELSIEGAHCAACVWLIERAPVGLPGFEDARLDLGRGRVQLRWSPERTSLAAVGRYLHSLGYATEPLDGRSADARRAAGRDSLRRLGVAGASAGWSMMLAFALYAGEHEMTAGQAQVMRWGSFVGALPALLYAAAPFYRSAWGALRLRVPHTDLPIALALILGSAGSLVGLLGAGEIYFDTLAVLVFLLLGARQIQAAAQREVWGRGTLRETLLPPTATRRSGETVSIGQLSVGDLIQVAPGELIPADGVARSPGWVDRALLTGESAPVPVTAGAAVHAGTRSVDVLAIEVSAVGDDTRVGRMVGLIDDARADRPALVRLTDRWAGRFVIGVLAAAALGGLAWSIVEPGRALGVVVALLVVSCPCALALAAPLVLALTRSRAGKRGLWFAHAEAIERLASADRVVFDKTGTLTQGTPRIMRAWGLDDRTRGWIAAVEAGSAHPLAHAVRTWADGSRASRVQAHPGLGVEGFVGAHRVRVGSPAWLASSAPEAQAALAAALSVVCVEVDGVQVGGFAVSDPIRPAAAPTVRALGAAGFSVSLASGDDQQVVDAVAATLGIAHAEGGLRPEDKAVRAQGAVMVGDGINDAVALRAADVGVAVATGAEVALEVADVALMGGVDQLVEAVTGARAAMRTIRLILAVSLAYNVVCASLALSGRIDALAAAILMPISSLFVALAALAGAPFLARPERRRPSLPEPAR